MKTLELKDLKYYLGTGLKCQYTGIINGKELSAEDKRLDGIDIFDPKHKYEVSPEYGLKVGELKEIKIYKHYWSAHIGIQRRGLKTFISGHGFMPLMLPLSALTEQLPDGSIPIVELAKISFPKSTTIRLSEIEPSALIDIVGDYDFRLINGSFECVYLRYSPHVLFCRVDNQLQLFEYLYQNHFWLGDQSLFETGEIIDKRTLK